MESMGNNLPKYTRDDIKDMINNKKYIFIVNNKVVDATDFAKSHPAGEQCFINHNGEDCTYDYNFHSRYAQKLWDERIIGNLKK